MKKNAIWLIVGLMGAALLAIILLQAYWIYEAKKLNEADFDDKVRSALNQVAIGLKEKEAEELLTKPQLSNAGLTLPNAGKSFLKSDSLLAVKKIEVAIMSKSTLSNKAAILRNFRGGKKPKSLEDRIDKKSLRDHLKRELKNRNIDIGYEFGVYSNQLEEIIWKNGHYLISDVESDEVTEMPFDDTHLKRSEHEVDLFTNDMSSPGKLFIYFPNKSSIIWGGDIWRALLASIISSAIVFFCFAYTINVIFTQKKLSEMKTDFINNMTHEFKTPIATISLASDSITNPKILNNADKVKRFANIIKQENRRMNKQVEKVLQMASLDKEDFKLNISPINLHEVIEQAAVNARLKVEQKEGWVETELRAEDAIIEADLTHISNIINNLLDNANKYSPEKPKISVSTRNVSGAVEVIVKDQGIGMNKEALKHIFDKFYRVHTGNLHDVKGFGLGLSYVKAMMTAHKGQVRVTSELGKGSSFILTLPKKFEYTV